MTVKELIAQLEKLPKRLPVYVESAPWGIPFEVEIVERRDFKSAHYSKKKMPGVFVTHDVGM